MPKRRPTPSARARSVGKRAASYQARLAQLREITSDFDAKTYTDAYARRPGKQRKAALAKVSRRFRQLAPYLYRTQKVVAPRAGKHAKRNLEELRKFTGFPRISGLRGIPIETAKPKKTSVSFDRKGRPTIQTAGTKWKLFRFPRMPRDGWHKVEGQKKKVFRTAAEDATELMRELVAKKIPYGFYVIMTRHHYLLHGTIERDQLVSEVQQMAENYNRRAPGFAKLIYGVKYLGRGGEASDRRRREERTEREQRKVVKKRLKSEKAAREIARMHKIFTGQTRDAELLALHEAHKRKRPRMSKRARATGRR